MIRFISGAGSHSGSMSSYIDTRVQITHDLREGYSPAFDGGTIREEMPLREFLGRIFREGREVENELYRVSKCLSGGYQYNNNELERVCDSYNVMYSRLIRQGKIVLAQHKMSHNMIGGIDPYQDRQQLMANQSDDYRRQAMMAQMAARPNPGQFLGVMQEDPSIREMHKEALEKDKIKQEKKKRDDDLYYLTT